METPPPSPPKGPKASPYASPSCEVYFKSGQLFRVPRGLLCGELESIRSSSNKIRLKHVLDEAGHVLIHYLHTGTWQTLDDTDLSDGARHLKRLEVSLHVYATAQTYHLPGLAEMAKEEISQYEEEALPALQILILASDACQLLGDDDVWFSAFIKLRVEQLFGDAASLDRTRLLTCFDTATPYSKMLISFIVEICCRNSTPSYPESQPTPYTEPDTAFEPEAATSSGVAESRLEQPEDPPPARENTQYDSWGLISGKKEKKKKKKQIQYEPREEAAHPMAIEESEPVPVQMEEPQPVVEEMKDSPDDAWGLSAKASMKKKKASSGFVW
ncbi:hypothetical protein LY78DRAFT_645917 [Colletotrichum sublineola]|nr:hypothetical protein LY78DRAFT_645917 [Colletotrichum sublineola]